MCTKLIAKLPAVKTQAKLALQHHLGPFGRRSRQSFFSQRLEEALPEALLYPQLVAPVGSLPLTELFRHLPPGGTRSRHPQDAAEYGAVLMVGAPRGRLVRDERLEPLPLSVDKRRSFGRERGSLRLHAILGWPSSPEGAFGGQSRPSTTGGLLYNRLMEYRDKTALVTLAP